MSSNRMDADSPRGLHRFACGTAGATFLLLIAGALVTSNDAGLAVPDWPLSYGTWMPPLVGNILYEHGHRMVASFVGLLTIVLAVWLWRREPRRWVRRLGLAALAVIVLQGILGGITVLFLLPRPVSIAHAALAQIFFCLAVALALVTGPAWRREALKTLDSGLPPLRRLSAATAAALFVQLLLGAAYRHSLVGILPHVAGAVVVAFFAFRTARHTSNRYAGRRELTRPAHALSVLVAVQLVLGPMAYLARLAALESPQPTVPLVFLTVAHLAVGALALGAGVILTLQSHRLLILPGRAPELAEPQKAAV